MKLHLTNAEVGLRPVGAIGTYAPEGMWNAEGWSRFAKSFRNRQNTFIRHSMLDVRVSRRHTALSLNIQTVRFK